MKNANDKVAEASVITFNFLLDRLVFQNLPLLSNDEMSGITEIDRKTPGGRR